MRLALLFPAALANAAEHTTASESEYRRQVEALVTERSAGTLTPSGAGEAEGDAREGELTADDAVALALSSSPAIEAAIREIEVVDAEGRQAALPANPDLELELREPHGPYEVAIHQDLMSLLLHARRKAIRSVRREAALLRAAHEVMDQAAVVRGAVHALQAATEVQALRARVADLARAGGELATRQNRTGNTSDLEHDRSQVVNEQAELELAASELETAEARERLAVLLGPAGAQAAGRVAALVPPLPDPDPDPAPAPAAAPAWAAELEALAVARRLDLRSAESEVQAASRAVPLERIARWPGLAVGVHLEREPDGPDSVGPAIELTLPLFDRGQAAAAGARARLAQSQERRLAAELAVRAEVRRAAARLAAAHTRAAYYRDVVLPRRARLVAETQRAYNFMLEGVYELVQARRDEVEAGCGYANARRDYWTARAELERAVAGSLDAVRRDKEAR